jgi:hypothetical protein
MAENDRTNGRSVDGNNGGSIGVEWPDLHRVYTIEPDLHRVYTIEPDFTPGLHHRVITDRVITDRVIADRGAEVVTKRGTTCLGYQ